MSPKYLNKNIAILGPSKVVEDAVNGLLAGSYYDEQIKKSERFVDGEILYFLTNDLLYNYQSFLPKNNSDPIALRVEDFLEHLKDSKMCIYEDDIITAYQDTYEIMNSIKILEMHVKTLSYDNGVQVVSGQEIVDKIKDSYNEKPVMILFELVLALFNYDVAQSIDVMYRINNVAWKNIFFNKGKSKVFLENQFFDSLVDLQNAIKVFRQTEIKGYFTTDRLILNFDFRRVFLSFLLAMYGNSNHIFDRMMPDEMLFLSYLQKLFSSIIKGAPLISDK